MAAVMASHPTLARPICALPQTVGPSTGTLPRASVSGGRRHCLFLLTAATALKAIELPPSAAAESIPLFGLRKKIQKAEEVAEEVVKEGIEAAEKGIETAEKGIETAEKEIETAALTIDAGVQAGAVAGAEILGVVVATSIVKGILGSET